MRRTWPLAAGDALVFVVFAVTGLRSHGEPMSAAGVVRNAAPLVACWFVAAAALRTYSRPGWRVLAANLGLGVTAGVLFRSVWLGHPTGRSLVVFLLVTLGSTALMLLAWRLAATRLLPDRAPAEERRP